MLGRTLLLAGVAAVCCLGLSAKSRGQDRGQDKKSGQAKKVEAEPSAEQLAKGPSLRETGRVGSASLDSGGIGIERRAALTTPAENSVAKVVRAGDAHDQAQRSSTGGFIDPILLDEEVQSRFSAARNCRVDVARHKRIAPAHVVATAVELRWTILPNGTVTGTRVIATAPVDPDVMNCLKLHMSGWTFTRPRGGPVAVDRAFVFR